jgi:PadR family transcriptional regulator PadR
VSGSNIITGTLDLLILKALPKESLHGYGISQYLRQVSDGVFEIGEGVLYPALHRLEKQGLLESQWSRTDTNRRAKFYRLTKQGRTHLTKETKRWNEMSGAVEAVLADGRAR